MSVSRRRLVVDTDVIVEYLRGRPEAAAFLEGRDEELLVSTLTVAELFAGLRGGEEERALRRFLAAFRVVAADRRLAERAGDLRRRWHPSHGTSLADAFIAATAIELDADLATFNTRHYPMLEVILPYRRT
jgi:predicted nucleic acid-binding protein